MDSKRISTGPCTGTATRQPTTIIVRRFPSSAIDPGRCSGPAMRGDWPPRQAAPRAFSGSNDLRAPDRPCARLGAAPNDQTHYLRRISMTLTSRGHDRQGLLRTALLFGLILTTLALTVSQALAHNVTAGDAGYIQEIWGVKIIPFIYLGAKHMVTGYDHILFLLGVVFFLYKMKDVGIYVSLFALGHSTTMLAGVWFGWGVNAYIIDAIIGLSVVYKALDNLGAYQRWFGYQPNTKIATLIFGFFHGTGLATKILEYDISDDGLLWNLLAFNAGVEVGQILALFVILIVMGYWRRSERFMSQAVVANVIMVGLGLWLTVYQINGFLAAA